MPIAPLQDDSKIVAIGASAGGLQAILELLSQLPARLAAPIVIALHSAEDSILTEVLQMKSDLPIRKAEDGDVLETGCVYILPGATHGFFRGDTLRLSEPVRDSGYRPSVDALFMSLASEHGDRGIAVVLSGTMSDGMRGAQIIYDMGGQTIVQDPTDAKFPEMPRNVINRDHPQVIATAEELGEWLTDHIGTN